ncbi:MAG: hypothetical protein J5733_05555 [Bacteroidaceae bacterium]|nr:hypothetical protein [Bacteroidaceae bacterium]
MTPDASCTVSVMKPEDYEWYTGMTFDTYQKKAKEMYGEDNSELVVISTNTQAGYSWFPTDLVCGTKEVYLGAGIIRSRFSIRTELAERTGCMLTGENAGSFQCYFRSAKVNEAIRILNENHWKCPKYEA